MAFTSANIFNEENMKLVGTGRHIKAMLPQKWDEWAYIYIYQNILYPNLKKNWLFRIFISTCFDILEKFIVNYIFSSLNENNYI